MKNLAQTAKSTQSVFRTLRYVNPHLKTLCLKMLEFNPHLRWSAKKCMQSPYFDDVRIPLLEKKSKHSIDLDENDYSL